MIDKLRIRLINRENPVRIHLIGVAGAGMSGLARMLLEMGHIVSGCDRVTSEETKSLQKVGLNFSNPHNPVLIKNSEIVIYSSAIREENPALKAAREHGCTCMRRAECLAAILSTKKGFLVAGTHGKTTTSSLTTHLMRKSGICPSHYVGAEIPVLGANAHWNEDSEYLIAEGDESDGTLVNYKPQHSIILNIEAEHLDFYNDIEHIKEVFHTLCKQTKGKIIYCKSDEGARSVCENYPNSISYGWQDADYTATNIRCKKGHNFFKINYKGEALGNVELGIPGNHNVLNALAAIAASIEMGADFSSIRKALKSFAGARRRFEVKYISDNYQIVDDYGHHPTEVSATLQTAQSLKPKRLIVLFQPHRYSRTLLLKKDFGLALQNLDILIASDIYPASELPIEGVSGQCIIDAVHDQGSVIAKFIPNIKDAQHAIGNLLKPGDMVLTLGAGNIHEAGTRLAADLRIMEELSKEVPEDIIWRLYEPMSKHSTAGIGGPAQYWIEPQTFEALQSCFVYFKSRNIPITIIGRGSNLIVRDGGIRGAVIRPSSGIFEKIELRGNQIIAGAGIRLKKLASFALQNKLSGFEWMEGIPGYVGGSLRQNAGSHSGEMWDRFKSAICLDDEGEIIQFKKERMQGASYRIIPEFEHNIVMQASFEGIPDDSKNIKALMDNYHALRKNSQPLEPSAGCTFINPIEGSAGKLIDILGLKGLSVGKAQISKIHANFIINTGGATAKDVIELIEIIRKKVNDAYGVTLQVEVQIIGECEI